MVKRDSFLWDSSCGVVTSKEPVLCTLGICAGEFEDSGPAFQACLLERVPSDPGPDDLPGPEAHVQRGRLILFFLVKLFTALQTTSGKIRIASYVQRGWLKPSSLPPGTGWAALQGTS